MFCVVQTKKRKNCRPEITVVPSSWVEGKTVHWPPAGFVTLSQNANSCPDKGTWKKSKAKVLGQATSYADAEIILASFQKLSESEVTDTETAGPSKPKKGRFESKQYELATVNSKVSDISRTFIYFYIYFSGNLHTISGDHILTKLARASCSYVDRE